MTDQDDWVRLEVGNSWEEIFYALPGERLSASGYSELRNALDLRAGMVVEFRWPDGEVETGTLTLRRNSAGYVDHGNSHRVTQERFGFTVKSHGAETWLPIELVDVRRGAIRRKRDVKP